jgi:hypothetical protein
MKEFVLLFRGGLNFQTAPKEQVEKAMHNWRTWLDQLSKEGKYLGGQRLAPGGTVLEGRDKKILDGPYAEGKEIVGGFMSIKADNLKEAADIASNCPIFDFNGTTEIREVAPTA